MTVVVDEVVGAAHPLVEVAHEAGDDAGYGVVMQVARLAGLEEDVRVLRRSAQHGCLGGEAVRPMGEHVLLAHEGSQVVVLEQPDARDLVRGAEAVEEVQERDAGAQGRGVRQEGEVVSLLHVRRAEHGPAGRPHRHDVAVIAEDRQGMRGDRAGGDVQHGGRELAGDLEHRGDHEKKALR